MKPIVTFIDKDKGLATLIRSLKGQPRLFGKAGVIGETASAHHGGAKNDAGGTLTNADLALVHEFGSPAAGIPERSFIRAAFDANREKYLEDLRKMVQAIYDRKMTLEQALGLLSAEAASDIRELIRAGEGIPPPDAPATVAHKGSSRPLVDSGQLLGAISHAVTSADDKGG